MLTAASVWFWDLTVTQLGFSLIMLFLFFACSAFLTLSKEGFILYYKFGYSWWIRGRFRVLFTEKKWKFNTDHPGQGRDPYAGIKGVTF